MAKKPNITTIASGYYSRQALNSNFEALKDGFDNTLSLDGSTPNAMGADLDMNNHEIINAESLDTKALRLDGVLVNSENLSTTGAALHSDTFTSDGSTVVYNMTYEPYIKDNTQVYVDGVYQNKDTYSVLGTDLTFSVAPPLNAHIEIVIARSFGLNNPNAVVSDLDMNDNDILNVNSLDAQSLSLGAMASDLDMGNNNILNAQSLDAQSLSLGAMASDLDMGNNDILNAKSLSLGTMASDLDMSNNDILNAQSLQTGSLSLGTMASDLDMSNNDILNAQSLDAQSLSLGAMASDLDMSNNSILNAQSLDTGSLSLGTMASDLDMSNNDILNAQSLDTQTLSLGGVPVAVTDGVPYLDGNQILMDRPKKRKIAIMADLQPIPYENRPSDDGNGPLIDQVQVVRDILGQVKVVNPDVNHIVLGGDLIDGAPPSLAEQAIAASRNSYVYGYEHIVPDLQTTAVAHISPISGNHDRDYRNITDRDRQEEGDPFYNYGTWFQKKFYYEIWGNFIHIYMGDMGGGPYGDDEGGSGIIPDYVFDWYKQVVENHKGFIPIVFTHQWIYDTGMGTSSDETVTQFIRLSGRFKDHMANYPISLWFSGHTMGDTATNVTKMHHYNATLGTLFVNMGIHVPSYSTTALSDLTYPILSLEDGSNIGHIKRWDHLAQDYVAAGEVSVTFPHKARLASVPDFDGRHQVSKFDPIEGKRTTVRSMEIDPATGNMLTGPYWMEDYIVDDRFNADAPAGVEVGNLFQAPMGLEEDPSVVPDTDEGVHSYGVVAALTGRRTSSGDSSSSGELVGYASTTGKTDASLVEVFSAKNDASFHVVGDIHSGGTLEVSAPTFNPSDSVSSSAIFLRQTGGSFSQGSFSGGLTFSKINSDLPFASIAAVATTADADTGGLAFFTHTATDSNNIVEEAMRIDSSGDVGINVTIPKGQLHVNAGAANLAGLFESTDSGATISLIDNATTGGFAAEHGLNTVGDQLEVRAVNNIEFETAGTPRVRINAQGNVGIGTELPSAPLDVNGSVKLSNSGTDVRKIEIGSGRTGNGYSYIDLIGDTTYSTFGARLVRTNTGPDANTKLHHRGTGPLSIYCDDAGFVQLGTDGAERMRVTSTGDVLVGKYSSNTSTKGVELQKDGLVAATADNSIVMVANRTTGDGQVIAIRKDGVTEGSISVSGTTVSYTGGHLARLAQTADNTRVAGLLKGTVLTNLDQMATWAGEDNEQLNCVAVSSVEGDPDVAGVFVSWDDDDEVHTADMTIAMTGDMVIRIAQGQPVHRGQLLMSAGDGTAKPQDDDIVRSKTIAKVISNHVSHTYADGSYCVPCVLMAC